MVKIKLLRKTQMHDCTQLLKKTEINLHILQKVITIVAATGLDQDQEGLGEVMTSEGIVMGAGDAPDENLGRS